MAQYGIIHNFVDLYDKAAHKTLHKMSTLTVKQIITLPNLVNGRNPMAINDANVVISATIVHVVILRNFSVIFF